MPDKDSRKRISIFTKIKTRLSARGLRYAEKDIKTSRRITVPGDWHGSNVLLCEMPDDNKVANYVAIVEEIGKLMDMCGKRHEIIQKRSDEVSDIYNCPGDYEPACRSTCPIGERLADLIEQLYRMDSDMYGVEQVKNRNLSRLLERDITSDEMKNRIKRLIKKKDIDDTDSDE